MGLDNPVFLTQITQKFSYDFAVDGGAVGNITLRGGTLPAGAIVIASCTDQTVAFTSGGSAQLAVAVESAGDLQTALLYSDITGVACLSDGMNATGSGVLAVAGGQDLYGLTTTIKTTAARSLVMAVSVAALTAGKFDLYITYMVP